MAYGTRAEMLEEKRMRRERERNRKDSIKSAKKELLIAPKKTRRSLGLLQIDPAGVLHFEDGRWMKFYRVVSGMKNYPKAAERLSGPGIFTAFLSDGRARYYITLIRQGDIYAKVKKGFSEDEEILSDGMKIEPLSFCEVVDEILYMAGKSNKAFDFKEFMKKRKDLSALTFPKVKEDKGGLECEVFSVEEFFIMEYPEEIVKSVLTDCYEIAGEKDGKVILSLEFGKPDEKARREYSEYLSKRYSSEVEAELIDAFLNVCGKVSVFFGKDKDRKEISKNIMDEFYGAGILIGKRYGLWEQALLSQISLGMIEDSDYEIVTKDVMERIFREEFSHDQNKV